MKKMLEYKKIIISCLVIIIIILFIFIGIKLLSKRKNNVDQLKKTIENVFYYLPDDNYTNMNDISDYCKIALLYNSDYLKSDYTLYDNDGNKIKGYTRNNILTSLKSIIGSDAYIDFNKNKSLDYSFLNQDSCVFANDFIANISYDENKKIIYSVKKEEQVRKLYIKWIDQNSETKLKAKALMAVKTDLGYMLYVDYNMQYLIGEYKNIQELEKDLEKNYLKSYDYEFEIAKNGDEYIWKSYKRVGNQENIIYD